MTKQEMKAAAYWHAATVVRNAIDQGWETESIYPDCPGLLEKCLEEVIRELENKGKLPKQK